MTWSEKDKRRDREKDLERRHRKKEKEGGSGESGKDRERTRDESFELAGGGPGADHLGSRPSGSQMPGQQGALASARRGCLPCGAWGMVEGPAASGRASTAGSPPSPEPNKLQLGNPLVGERRL